MPIFLLTSPLNCTVLSTTGWNLHFKLFICHQNQKWKENLRLKNILCNLLHGTCLPVPRHKSSDKGNSRQDVTQGQECAAPGTSCMGHRFYCRHAQLMLVHPLFFLQKQIHTHTQTYIWKSITKCMVWTTTNKWQKCFEASRFIPVYFSEIQKFAIANW